MELIDQPLAILAGSSKRVLVTRLMVLLIFSISALTACAPRSETQPSNGVGQEFTAQAVTVCQAALETKQAWAAFPVADFNPTQPDPADFPEVAAWLEDEVGPTFEAWLDGLTALGEPPSGQEPWNDVLTAVDGIVTLNNAQVAAAKSGDAEAFVEATNDLQAIQVELEQATEAAGVPNCADVHK